MRIRHFIYRTLMACIAAVIITLLPSCTGQDGRMVRVLDTADSLMAERPDSALTLLEAMLPDTTAMHSSTLMRYHLLRTNARNKCDTVLNSTDLAHIQRAAEHYDKDGTPNERMLAHYLAGRCYADMGEAPAALEEYHLAIDKADTTRNDISYHDLMTIYSQLQGIFYNENLFREQLESCRKARWYALKDRDTISSVIFEDKMASAYEMLGMRDSAVYFINESRKKFQKIGRKDLASQLLPSLMAILIEQKGYAKLPPLFREYEGNSGYFDEKHEIADGNEQYYWLKGSYLLGINSLDSAGRYFRKCLSHATNSESLLCACDGLSRLYRQQHVTDSALKYTLLASAYKDSVNDEANTLSLMRIQQQYRYDRYARLAKESELEAERTRYANMVLVVSGIGIFVLLVLITAAILLYMRKRRKDVEHRYNQLSTEYANYVSMYRQAVADASRLHQKGENLEVLLSEKTAQAEQYVQTIEQMRLELSAMEEKHNSLVHTDGGFASVKSSRAYETILESLDPPFVAPVESEWKQLRSAVDKYAPRFSSILVTDRHLNTDDYDLCILIRLGFKNKDVMILKGWSESSISMKCARVYMKLTGKKGSAKALAGYLSLL